jgi:tetratricopeptide (TPR) repeat protein
VLSPRASTTLVALLFAGRFPAHAQSFTAQDVDALHARACERLAAGDAAAAAELLTEVVARRPSVPDFALRLAEAHVACGRRLTAESILRNFTDHQPQAVGIRLALARLYAADEPPRWRDVIDCLAPAEADLDATGIALLADALMRTNDAGRAAECLRTALERLPGEASLWLAYVDCALRERRCVVALQRLRAARRQLPDSPALDARAARTYFELDQVLGETSVRHVPAGRCGQFAEGVFLFEPAPGRDRFVCCPPESALFQVRRALDAGLDDPAVHHLHARIWLRLGRPHAARAVLTAREAELIESGDESLLETCCEAALAVGDLDDYLRLAQLRARRFPVHAGDLLFAAYAELAQRYNVRGEMAPYLRCLERALERRPNDVRLMLELADGDWAVGRQAEAVRWYRSVLAAEPQHAERQRICERLAAATDK